MTSAEFEGALSEVKFEYTCVCVGSRPRPDDR